MLKSSSRSTNVCWVIIFPSNKSNVGINFSNNVSRTSQIFPPPLQILGEPFLHYALKKGTVDDVVLNLGVTEAIENDFIRMTF